MSKLMSLSLRLSPLTNLRRACFVKDCLICQCQVLRKFIRTVNRGFSACSLIVHTPHAVYVYKQHCLYVALKHVLAIVGSLQLDSVNVSPRAKQPCIWHLGIRTFSATCLYLAIEYEEITSPRCSRLNKRGYCHIINILKVHQCIHFFRGGWGVWASAHA